MATLFRASIINPLSATEFEYFEDGALVVEDEKIIFCGNFSDAPQDIPVEDFSGRVIIPGFADTHIHLPQYDVRGKFEKELLPWLKEYIWPEESKFKDPEYARDVSRRFFADLVKNGTITASVYATIHEGATKIAFEECPIRAVIGKVLMDMNSPDYLVEDTTESIAATERLCKEYAKKGDRYFAVTPRFAPTCSIEQMTKVAELAKKYDTYIQTHLSENKGEIEWVKELFPGYRDYTDVYDKCGLLGPKTIMAHVIYCSDDELRVLKNTGTVIAHCPTSNVTLMSGRMPIEKIREFGIPFSLATDVGAGPDISMFDVMRSFMEVHKEVLEIKPTEALYYATLAGAEMLGFAEESGNLAVGKSADFLVLDVEKGDPDSALSGICDRGTGNYGDIVLKTFFKSREAYSKE